jgi:hypothetical protein
MGEDAEEDGLQDVFGVSRNPGDAQGRAEDRCIVALVEPGKTRQFGCGSHVDGIVDWQAGRGHVIRLTA